MEGMTYYFDTSLHFRHESVHPISPTIRSSLRFHPDPIFVVASYKLHRLITATHPFLIALDTRNFAVPALWAMQSI